MTELDSLIAQRKELDEKIKALKSNENKFGTVRITRCEGRGGYYNVQTLVKTLSDYQKNEMWFVTIRERTKAEVAHRIRVLITDMSELLASIEGDEKCEKD